MQNLLFPLAALLVCLFSFFLLLRDREIHGKQEKTERSVLIYSVVMILLTVVLSALIPVWFSEASTLALLKRVLLMCVVWPVAYIDYKTYRIPNAFVLFGLAVRALLLLLEMLYDEYWKLSLISEGIAAGALFAASMLCAALMKGSIGFGDIKMFVVLGLFLGIEGSWAAIFLALVLSLAVALVLMAAKKKSRKDAIPFGPSMVLATYLTVCLTGM